MKAVNKWNKKTYVVLEVTDSLVTLQRPDGTQFTIQKKEYIFSYIPENKA